MNIPFAHFAPLIRLEVVEWKSSLIGWDILLSRRIHLFTRIQRRGIDSDFSNFSAVIVSLSDFFEDIQSGSEFRSQRCLSRLIRGSVKNSLYIHV